MTTLSLLINEFATFFPPGVRELIVVFFYFSAVFTVVGCITALISVVNHVKGLITFG